MVYIIPIGIWKNERSLIVKPFMNGKKQSKKLARVSGRWGVGEREKRIERKSIKRGEGRTSMIG